MDDPNSLQARADGAIDYANARYNQKLIDEREHQKQATAPAIVTGWRGNEVMLQRLGPDQEAGNVNFTTGAIGIGDAPAVSGNLIGSTPRVKATPPATAPAIVTGQIKYLYSIVGDGITSFYVGGWQKKSVLIRQFDAAFTVFFGSLDNLGGNRWSANFSYLSGSRYYVEYLPSSGTGWTLESPVPATSFGHGFWRADNQTVDEFSSGVTGIPPDNRIEFISDHKEVDFWYAWANQSRTQHQTTYDLYSHSIGSNFAEGVYETSNGYSYVRSSYSLIFLPLDKDFSGKSFTYVVEDDTTGFSDGSSGTLVGLSTCTNTSNTNTLLKVNEAGQVGVGVNSTYNTSESAGVNQPYFGCLTGTTYAYSTIYTADGAIVSTDTTDLTGFYLDLKDASLTGIKKNQSFYVGSNADADKKLEVTFFNGNFRQSKKKYAVFKPSINGSDFIFRSASYHL